jgi:hypothetical protein
VKRENKKLNISEVREGLIKLNNKIFHEWFTPIDKEGITKISSRIRTMIRHLDDAFGTGKENVEAQIMEIMSLIQSLEISINKGLLSAVYDYLDRIESRIVELRGMLCGQLKMSGDNSLNKKEVKTRNRILLLEEQKADFNRNRTRIKEDLRTYKKEIEGLEAKILEESNPIAISDYYRDIKSKKAQERQMSVRYHNYSSCYDVLERIIQELNENFRLRKNSNAQLLKINTIIDRYLDESILDNPEKTLSVLKHFEQELAEMMSKNELMDKRLFASNNDEYSGLVDEALDFKLKLINKKKEQENLEKKNQELGETKIKKINNEGEN